MTKESRTIKLLHSVDTEKLARVVEEMRTLGAPEIRVVWDDMNGIWHAADGTHRLTAAHKLGLTPVLTEITWGEAADLLNEESGSCWTGEELESDCKDKGRVFLTFPDDLTAE